MMDTQKIFEGYVHEVTHAALDANGLWHVFGEEPTRSTAAWHGKNKTRVPQYDVSAPFWEGNWQHSLIARTYAQAPGIHAAAEQPPLLTAHWDAARERDLFGTEPDQAQADYRITFTREQLVKFVVTQLRDTLLLGDEHSTDLQTEWTEAGGISIAVRQVAP